MIKQKHKRLAYLITTFTVIALGIGLILWSLNQNLMYFYTPSELKQTQINHQQMIRLGGLVKKGSLTRKNKQIHFVITDQAADIYVTYTGALPDLFREGQGVVATGRLTHTNHFDAESILAKHDENYMPEELKEKLEQQGIWKGNAE